MHRAQTTNLLTTLRLGCSSSVLTYASSQRSFVNCRTSVTSASTVGWDTTHVEADELICSLCSSVHPSGSIVSASTLIDSPRTAFISDSTRSYRLLSLIVDIESLITCPGATTSRTSCVLLYTPLSQPTLDYGPRGCALKPIGRSPKV